MTESMPSPGTAFITGGAARIGQAMSLRLAERGYKIALHYHRSKQQAQKTADMIHKKGGTCKIFACDLSKTASTEKLISKVTRTFKDLNIVINNASIFEPSTLQKTSITTLDNHLNLHLKAPLILTRDFSRICKKGHVINIVDTHITQNKTHHFEYILSKKGLWNLTQLAAVELAPHIRVNAIAPGLILPPKRAPKYHNERSAKQIPLKRVGAINHIISSLDFLLQNDYLTGQILYADGGEHLI